ncbi:MAG: hypothetical protein CMJ83_17860 [Planctomycetes bacterium]|nr:hypothetical protein [Planctomycetota bacterium]
MKTARDVMHTDVITVTPTDSIAEVAQTLSENGISGAPVVDVNGTLRGILSRADVLNHALQINCEATHPVISILIPGTAREDEVYRPKRGLDTLPEAQDLMSGEVIAVEPVVPLQDVAQLMNRERIHRVPVVEDGKLVGIITSLDLLGSFPGPFVTAPPS